MSDNKSLAAAEKNKGNELYKQKQFEDALACYDKAIELDPTDMTFLNNKAAVYFEQGKYEECTQQCQKAVEVGRENRADFKLIAKAYARMGNAYHKLGDWPSTRQAYEKSLTEHRTPETRAKLAEVEKIIKEAELKAYIDPAKADEEKTKGNEYFQKGDYPNAIKHYTEAIKRNPDDAKLYSNRAASYQKLAEFSLALKDCEECIRLDPNFVKGYTRKGLAYLAMKQFSQAQSAYQKALELDENNKEAIEGFKKCAMSLAQDPEEARKRALTDPEVQQILADPAMRVILEQMQSDPSAIREHVQNPHIQSKIYKLIEAGIISIR